MAAPLGNRNNVKNRPWASAIQRALERRGHSKLPDLKALDELAEKLLDAGNAGDQWALKEIGDRLDGKAHQSIGTDEGENALQIQITHYTPGLKDFGPT